MSGDRPDVIRIGSLFGKRERTDSDGFWTDMGESAAAPKNATSSPSSRVAEALARFPVTAGSTYASLEPAPHLIDGLVPCSSLSVLFAASGDGKSFWSIAAGCAIGLGEDFRELRTREGRVVYLVLEGRSGFRRRLAAWMKYHDRSDVPMDVIDAGIDLTVELDAAQIALVIKATGGADLLIVDTLAQATAGQDENSSEAVGRMIRHCQKIIETTGVSVLLVAHAGKDRGKGIRGHSSLHAAADSVLEIRRDGDIRTLVVVKSKDGEEGAAYPFRLKSVALAGPDADGVIVTSAVVEHIDAAPIRRSDRQPRGAYQIAIHDIVRAAGEIATEDAITEARKSRIPHDEGSGKPDRRRDSLVRAIKDLIAAEIIRKTPDEKLSLAGNPFGAIPEDGESDYGDDDEI